MKATLKLMTALSLLTLGTGQALAQGSGSGPQTNPILRINTAGEVRFGNGASEQVDYRRDRPAPIDFRARPEQLSGGTPCPGTYGPSVAGAPCNGPRPVRRDITCNVNFTGVDLQDPPAGSGGLKKFVLSGNHNAPEGGYASRDFSVVDNDGFLTLAAVHAHWQTAASGVIRVNSGSPSAAVHVPPAELRLAREAATMGMVYYTLGLERISVEPRPENYEEVARVVNEKIRILSSIVTETTLWEANPNGVPAGRIRAIFSEPLERFATGVGDELLRSQYRDSAFGDRPQLFCNSEAESDFVGQVLCHSNFVDGDVRDTAFCGGGITFGRNSLTSLRNGDLGSGSTTGSGANQR